MAKNRLSIPLLAIAAIAARPNDSATTRKPRAFSNERGRNLFPSERRKADADRTSIRSVRSLSFAEWRKIGMRTLSEFSEDRLMAVAAGCVFYVILALFPAITAFVSLYGLFADRSTIESHLGLVAGLMPADAFQLIRDEIVRISSQPSAALGVASVMAILFALWSANAGSKAIFDSLNVATDSTERRSFIKLTLISLAFTLGGLAFMLIAVAAVVVLPLVFAAFRLNGFLDLVLSIARWPLLLVLVAVGLSVTYYIGPSRERARWRWVTPGSLLGSFLFLIISAGFSWYLSNFADYNATYGSLGAAIGLMMWMWLTFCAVLIGAEFDSEVDAATAPAHEKHGKEHEGARK